jgi:hypothetical protein
VSSPTRLAPGLYDHLVTHELSRDLATVEPPQRAAVEPLAVDELGAALARHVGAELQRLVMSDNYFCRSTTTTSAGCGDVRTAG